MVTCTFIKMSKKITRKEAVALMTTYANGISDAIVEKCSIVPDKFITRRSYVDKGQNVEEFYCQACGTTHTKLNKSGYYRHYNVTCPACGNNKYAGGNTSYEDESASLYVEEIDGGFKFALYKVRHHFDHESSKWWLLDPTVTVDVKCVGSFDNENGWYVYDVLDSKLLSRNSMAEESFINRVKSCKPANSIDGDFSVMLAEAAVYEAKKSAANAAKKAGSKSTLLENMRANYKPKEIEEEKIGNGFHGLMYEVYSTKDDKTTYMACCTKCGTIFETEGTNGSDDIETACPSCGMSGEMHRGRYSYSSGYRSSSNTVVFFENTNLPENDLLVRVFEVEREFSIDRGYKQKIGERQRIFCGKKVNVYTRSYNYSTKTYGDFEKGTVRDIDYCLTGWRTDGHIAQDETEIAQIIRNSCLMYSGLVEAYGFGDKRYKSCENAPSLKYLMAWYKKPAIELILKSNMTTIMDHMINEPDHIGDGKTLAEALKVSPSVAKIAAKLNLDYSSLTDLSALYNADNNLTADSFMEIKRLNLPTFQLAQLKSLYHIDYAQTMKYLDAVYNHQCIEKREALTQWVDYLRMATALRIDLTDKSRLYPGSLKKEHDVATFAFKAIQLEVDKEKFAMQAEQNAYFEYTYKDLMVVIPRTPQDIVEEATRQKNCLRSYVEQVKNGSTVVAFIRRKIMPDATYVTAEVRDGRLIQLKGYCNSNPRNKELVEFVQHWSKAKGIRVEC